MNPNLEIEEVIEGEVFAYFGEEHELAQSIYRSIQHWMARNNVIFYWNDSSPEA